MFYFTYPTGECSKSKVTPLTQNWGPGLYNSLHHIDNRKYFLGLCLTWNQSEAHMFYLEREVGKIWRCPCWDKGNFIMINEFKYGQNWKIWPSALSLSLYSTFKWFCELYLNVFSRKWLSPIHSESSAKELNDGQKKNQRLRFSYGKLILNASK